MGILSCWNRLLSDIRYAVNTEIVKKKALKEEEMKSEHCNGQFRLAVAMATDDLIGIVAYILVHT